MTRSLALCFCCDHEIETTVIHTAQGTFTDAPEECPVCDAPLDSPLISEPAPRISPHEHAAV